jgi:hypothetical protein
MLLIVAGLAATAGRAEESAHDAEAAAAPRILLQTSHFALHTDLPQDEAEATLARMEASLKAASRYWNRKPRGQIACYVARNLADWPDSALPHPLARVWVGGTGGAAISDLERVGKIVRQRATVYAASGPGIVEHEVVHAYCCQTFGATGPDWYKEGMAQSLAFHAANPGAAGCPPELVRRLNQENPRTPRDIVRGGRFTKDISASFGSLLANRNDPHRHVPLGDWTDQDAEMVLQAGLDYDWSWSLCHMLLENSNYAARFQTLGESYLAGNSPTFDDAFSSVADQMAFEHAFFLRHMAADYRVDLCRWDWQTRFSTLDRQAALGTEIEAARGFQASRLAVAAGCRYHYATHGSWATSADGPTVSADGDAGRGTMVAAVMSGFELGEPFDLGRKGSFLAPANGNLYIRCRDAWDQLDDNRGKILVRFARQE